MDIAQDLHIFSIYSFTLYLLYAINDFIFKLLMPLDSSTLLKNHGSCNFMLKYYFTISLQRFFSTKILNQFFSLCRATENLEICACLFFFNNWMNRSSFNYIRRYDFYITVTRSETGIPKALLRIPARSEFSLYLNWKRCNHFHNILRLMFYQIFFSPQVKRCTIITYKQGM